MTTMHIGRAWAGHEIEDGCPCRQAPCGLAIPDTAGDCPHHDFAAAKTIRQMHYESDCPADDDLAQEVPD